MNALLRERLDAGGGVITRSEALEVVSAPVFDRAVRTQQLVRRHPAVYVDPSRVDEPRLRVRAALRYAGPGAAVSHVTALPVWGLPGGRDEHPIHVTVGAGRRLRPAGRELVVHRRRGFCAEPPEVLVRSGVPTVRVESCVADSWPLLPEEERRATVIAAVGERVTTPTRLLAAVDERPTIAGRHELVRMLHLLGHGCRSELELWGYDHVFAAPGMPRFRWQVPVSLGRRTVYLDVYCPQARVDFELDGASWHASRSARERDLRRDAQLATLGIMVVRFTHAQLRRSPEEVRRCVREVVAARPRFDPTRDPWR